MRNDNPYLNEIYASLPRLLASFDQNPYSPSYGQGDRYRWAWKLIDFGNASHQGAAYGLALLTANNLLPNFLNQKSCLQRIENIFEGTWGLRRSDGSYEEAFPMESSYCVTALVAHDLLSSIKILKHELSSEQISRWLRELKPSIDFLEHHDESHAMISNHLITAVAALNLYSELTRSEPSPKASDLLSRVLDHQSSEGWFQEYEGFDPGYETLSLHYFSSLGSSSKIDKPLADSVQFISHFIHPDGSIGGCYGSRNTRFYFPSGFEYLANENQLAASVAAFMAISITNFTTVTLSSMDPSNFVPMFNSYCKAASLWQPREAPKNRLPCFLAETWKRHFEDAGLFIRKSLQNYSIVSLKKGGTVSEYPLSGSTKEVTINTGLIGKYHDHLLTTPSNMNLSHAQVSDSEIEITSEMIRFSPELPSPMQFIILRLLSLSFMRVSFFRNWIKKVLVRRLITGQRKSGIFNKRRIILDDPILVLDSTSNNNFKPLASSPYFSSIHMASQGYWQSQDDA